MEPTLFCPTCHLYLGPTLASCPACEWPRPPDERLLEPGEPLWQAKLPGPARGRPVIAGELLLCAWGERRGTGGLSALDLSIGDVRWQVNSEHGIEASPAISEGRVYYASLGFLNQDARLYCCRVEDGGLLWSQLLGGGVWSAPLVDEMRVYAACDDGSVYCFDASHGEPVTGWPIRLEKGRAWLLLVEEGLVVLSESGQVHLLDRFLGRRRAAVPWSVGKRITSAPALHDKNLYFGVEGGSLLVLDYRNGQAHTLAEGLVAVVARPFYAQGSLYVTGHNRMLQAMDIDTGQVRWQRRFEHSFSSASYMADGLVVASANGGETSVLAADTGELVGSFQHPGKARLMSDPLITAGVIYAGGEDGNLCALPWHLGEYTRAAEFLVQRKSYAQAAMLYAIAGDLERCDPDTRQDCHAAALQNWRRAGEWEKAARFRELLSNEHDTLVAEEYERAGQMCSRQDSELAANLLHRAADWYDLANQQESVQRCRRAAARVAYAPYIHIRRINVQPVWEEGEEYQAVVELVNYGQVPAANLGVRLAGILAARVWVQVQHLLPAQRVEIEAPLVALNSGDLVVFVEYTGRDGRQWSTSQSYPITVKPSSVQVEIKGSVGWLDLKGMEGKIRVHGDVGLVKKKIDQG